ncbi:coproporphyrinogen III oxidase, partial [Bordetella pertussis]|nr:coproporphyrinogen III oxidase [Bordetella pertussis]
IQPIESSQLAQARLPIERGLRLSADDELRRRLIMAVMCRGRLALAELGGSAGAPASAAFGPELARLRELAGLGLVTLDAEVMQVTELGWYFVRAVAMTFDRYLREAAPAASYSRIV